RIVGPVLLVAATSCDVSTNKLLSVQTPDVIAPGVVNNAAGADALRNGALVQFGSSFGGGLGYATMDGLFSDQLISGRQQLNFVDQRAWDPVQSYEISQFWSFQTEAERAINAMKQYTPDRPTRKANLAELYALLGVMHALLAELQCNGVPIGHLLAGGTATYDINLSNADVWNRGLAYLDSATGQAPSANVTNLIAVTRARLLLNLATKPSDPKFAQAAAAVASVPTTFRYDATYTSIAHNGLSQWIQESGNFGVSDKEGINGLNYLSSGDPRVGAFTGARARLGQDGITPIYFPRQSSDIAQPQVVASGTEARLIEAEVQLAQGNPAWLTTLNNLRAASPPWPGTCYVTPTTTAACGALAANLTDPGTPSTQIDLVFRERAFWLYLTAHRTGDLRRLVRQYGRDKDSVFPTGAYFHGGVYGTDYNMPVTTHEWDLIPGYKGCTDRTI